MDNLRSIKNTEIIALYGEIIRELRERKIIRTRNVVGDLGERFAIDYYKQNHLDNLADAPISSKNVDARGDRGEYAIKSITTNVTGVFNGLPPKDDKTPPGKLFDFLIIVKFSKSYEVLALYELTWDNFIEHKKWHKRMQAWYILLSNEVKNDSMVKYLKVFETN